MNIEKEVAHALLQEGGNVTIGGYEFKVEQPTVATLIKVSGLISTLPEYDKNGMVLSEVLTKAKDMSVLVDIAAYLVLGVKRVNEHRTIIKPTETAVFRFSWRKMRKVKRIEKKELKIEEFDLLKELLMENVTISQMSTIITERLKELQINDFFAITASLKGAMITKRTKEAETQSGD